ncbi:biotin/lipoyl-binding protein [Temperatibacter marinus]|uniref:Biotin/lipoyl-binding protein n=1 Tax=Temperatibacter marinus TaxID=1456591 RepID=A0AA52EI31_9PROT|nr:biotin/lipoyl-binding protein [Temperatibacter marinus]WND02937.1 biotin/lipoyl-binding protein [Temperatibacter marinus]
MAFLPEIRENIDLVDAGYDTMGAPQWRLHDPIRNRFFQIGWVEYNLLRFWGRMTPEQLLEKVSGRAALSLEMDDIEEMIEFITTNQLIKTQTYEEVSHLKSLAPPKKSKLNWALHNYLFLRIHLYSPDALYSALHRKLAFLYSPFFLLIACLTGCISLIGLSRQWDSFSATFSYLFTTEGLVLSFLALGFSKICHEIGHGLTAKHFGLRVSSTGVAFIVLWPVLFTDLGEIWRLKSHHKRLMISAGGVLAEALLAIVSISFWLLLDDGPLRSAFFIQATLALAMTLLINLNPFMRFDGYYLLADATNTLNLQDRSFAAARSWLRGAIGLVEIKQKKSKALIVFGLGTWVYRFFLFLGIAILVYFLFPKIIGTFLAVVELAWFIGMPVWKEISVWHERRQEFKNSSKVKGILCLVMLLCVLLLPLRTTVDVPAVLIAVEESRIYATSSGEVIAVTAVNGQSVEAGDVLLRIKSNDLEAELESNFAEEKAIKAQLITIAYDEDAKAERKSITEKLGRLYANRRIIKEALDRLIIAAPITGYVRDWPTIIKEGQAIKKDTPLGVISGKKGSKIVGYVHETDFSKISKAASMLFYPDNMTFPVLKGTVSARGISTSDILEEIVLASDAGGVLPVRDVDGLYQHHSAVYRVEFSLEGDRMGQQLHDTIVGTAVVNVDPYSYLEGFIRSFIVMLNNEFEF